MPDPTTQAAVILGTVVAAIALASGIARTLRRREGWSFGALLGACFVILTFSFVQLLATYTNSWVEVTDVYRNVSLELPDWGQMLFRLVIILIVPVAIALFIAGMVRRDAQVNIPAVLIIIVLLVSLGSSLLNGDIPFQAFSVAYLCILLACVFAPRGLSVHLGIATVCMVAAIASGIALVAHQDVSVIECLAGHKCGVLGFNFRGVLGNENALALYLALAMPFVYIGFGGWEGLVMSGYLAGLILLTGSRSGTLTAVVTFAVLVVVRPDIRRPKRTPVRSTLLSGLLVSAFAIGLVLPLVVQDPSALSGRAALWQLARNTLADPAAFAYGTGLFGWNHVHEAGLIDASAVYSVHNQWLQVLFSTGIIGLVFFLGAISVLLWQARNGYFQVAACVLVPFFILGVTERPWPIDTADWLCWAVPGALLCYPVVRQKPSVDSRDSIPEDDQESASATIGVSRTRSEEVPR
ncbi:MAG: O-antigen ligase family protein [Actinomycetia bacterium]|nr:O-antigen ligase family protein [Actinomycetes bacterium]